MNPYHVIIIDDEPLALDVIEHYLKQFDNYIVTKRFTDPIEAFTYINANKVDLVFTDIAMPNISGTELVRTVGDQTRFIMTTSYSDYAIESFELNVVDYLLKPISLNRFAKAISHFEKEKQDNFASDQKNNAASFFIKEGEEYIKVVVDDIDYIEGMKDYAKIVCGKHYYLALKTLKSVEILLEKYQFLRIHKSYIVPLKKVKQYNGRFVFIDTHEIPVGANYRETLKEYLISNKF